MKIEPTSKTVAIGTRAAFDNATPRRNAYGEDHMLSTCAADSGRVELDRATAHWWLLPMDDSTWRACKDPDGAANSKAGWGRSYDTDGHVAVLVNERRCAPPRNA